MPSHSFHKKRDKQVLGKAMPDVHRFLDIPEVQVGPVKVRLPHKSIHNPLGLALVYSRYGRKGLVSATNHMIDDLISEGINKQIKKLLKHS